MPPLKASEAVRKDYDRLRETAGSVELGAFAALALTGEDRKGWLQGQVTNDVKGLIAGYGRSFCLCEPTGHLLAVLDAWALDDRIVMTTARERALPVLERVERMTIMEDVVAHDLTDDYTGLSIQGPTATHELAEFMALPTLDAGKVRIESMEADLYVLRSNRTGAGGWDIWLPKAAEAFRASLLARFPSVSREAFEAARLETGIPTWNADMGPRTLPPELGPAFEARHVSYRKGCYTGQEVLMRIHSQGHTNRTWVGLLGDAPIEVGATVLHRGKPVGTVSSTAFSPDFGPIAAAILRNEAAYEGERVEIDGTGAEVRRMPILRPE